MTKRARRKLSEAVMSSEKRGLARELVFYAKGAMSFEETAIPQNILAEILSAATSSTWLGRWKMVAVNKKGNIVRVVEAWQSGLRRLGQHKGVEFVERWKAAPLLVVFCQPAKFGTFQFVPAEYARIYGIFEVGNAVRSIELIALTYGVGLHGIMGVLIPEVGGPIKTVLRIPEDQEIVFLGVMGYPKDEATQKFPRLEQFCYSEEWGSQLRDR